MDERFDIDCSVAFRSSGRATLKLCYTHHTAEVEEEMETILEERLPRIFSQAFQTIRDHPLLANVIHLHPRRESRCRQSRACYECCWATVWICGSTGEPDPIWLRSTTISDAFLDTPLFPKAIQPASFPPVKELVITNPVQSLHNDKVYAAAIVKLARSQHTRGVPF
jgi:hypothetical protein